MKGVGNNDNQKSSLDALKQNLYERETKLSVNEEKRSVLRRKGSNVAREWEDARIDSETSSMTRKTKTHNWVGWFVVIATLFFVSAIGIAVYMFGAGGNVISTNNVTIGVTGPVSIPGGETLTLQIDVRNGNTATLETTDLLIEYPEGTRAAENITTELPRARESIGDIRPGEEVTTTVAAVLFGEEGERQTITISVEYRVAGSNAIFVKERSYEVEISSSPLSLSVTAPEKTTTDNQFELVVEVTSNAEEEIKGVLLSAEYPFGFTYEGSTPEPAFNNRVWNLGDIEPGDSVLIRIRGSLSGQDAEERVFRFASGLAEETNPNELVTPFIELLQGVAIARPDIGVGIVFNGERTGTYVAESNNSIRTDIAWQNNTGERIVDGVVEVKIVGDALDPASVSAGQGFYQSGTNSIVWDKRSVSALANISAGGSGAVSFNFASDDFTRETLTDPDIEIRAVVRGTVAASEGAETVISEAVGKVSVASDLLLSGRSLHFTGPIQNTGPIPPKVGEETTYTVVWTVTNTVSEVNGVRVRATLPSHMRFVGNASPAAEQVSYNEVGGEVLWDLGTVRQGAGYTATPREVAFQVALVPSISQVGDDPTIINGATLAGTDTHTRTQVRDTHSGMTTRINSDPQFKTGDDKVVE